MPQPAKPARTLLFATAAALAVALPALAQDRPESILPPGFGDPSTATPPAAQPAPANAAPAEPAAPTASPGTSRDRAPSPLEGLVSIDDLLAEEPAEPVPQIELPAHAERDPTAVGFLSPAEAGQAERPWGGAKGSFLSTLLRRMDTPLASRWVHIGLRNALSAKADAPYRAQPVDWVAERAWLLLRMGEADAARMLVSGVDVDDFTPKMVQVAVQSALANSDPSGLCPLTATAHLAKVERKAAPLIEAMCASLSGDSEAAAADIERARRRGSVGGIDLSLADKLVGAGADSARAVTIEWEPVDQLTSWRYGLATATGMEPPTRLFSSASPQVVAWKARAPMLTVDQRLPAARVAAGLGVLSSTALVDLYAQQFDQTDPDELGASDAWQLRLAYVGRDLDTRLAAMRTLWKKGNGRLEQAASRALLARAATLVRPSADHEADITDLLASMLAGGYEREAAAWIPAVAEMDEAAADKAWAMLALAAPNTTGIDLSKGRIEDFIDRDDSPGKANSGLLVAGLAGLGRIDPKTAGQLSAELRLGLGQQTLWTRLIDGAMRRGQSGTAMLLAASGLQGRSFAAVQPLYQFHAVHALSRTGQDFMARMIAAEAIARS